ncbi:MAG: hypothetical protein WDZ88_01605 [Candidatus Paceibacterota bacterium]
MPDVEFEESQSYGEGLVASRLQSRGPKRGPIIDLLISSGLIKTEKGANAFMLASSIIFILLSVFLVMNNDVSKRERQLSNIDLQITQLRLQQQNNAQN